MIYLQKEVRFDYPSLKDFSKILLLLYVFIPISCTRDKFYEDINPGVVMPWKIIDIDTLYGGAWVIVDDINNDGLGEIVSAKNFSFYPLRDEHYTSSLIVYNLNGSILWKWGDPTVGINRIHNDVACQSLDWNNDGQKEIVLASDQYLIELNGLTGNENRRFPIPKDASDCLLFADLSPHSELDVIVKNRYSRVFAFSYDGSELWSLQNSPEPPDLTAHFPRAINLDSDVYDEVITGYKLLDNDGKLIWDLKSSNEFTLRYGHLDCARVLYWDINPDNVRIAITCCMDSCLAVINGTGKKIWSIRGNHFEKINVGKVRNDIQGDQIIVDIDHKPFGNGPLWILDNKGNLLSQIATDYSRFHEVIDWFGTGTGNIIIGQSHCIYDGFGVKVAELEFPDIEYKREDETICLKKDCDNDGIPEILIYKNPLKKVYIYKSPNTKVKSKKEDREFTFYK